MSKTFRAYDMNQQLLLPPDLRQWLRDDHLALYVSDVVEALDLTGILNKYEEGDSRGRPPYHPALMVKLLVYGYCTGRMSSMVKPCSRASSSAVSPMFRPQTGSVSPSCKPIRGWKSEGRKAAIAFNFCMVDFARASFENFSAADIL